ncbi:MAG TPA: Ig-like domain-containing protein [Mycobacterium sp.]|nr:Ig-like domain-containing protein [Mycobacterium sp.]HQC75953.1 Ig-like domain-containing protein [Mycobacterium sp.]
MSVVRGGARFGAVTLVLGLSVLGPQAVGIAVADTGDGGSSVVSDAGRGSADASAARTASPARRAASNPGRAAGRRSAAGSASVAASSRSNSHGPSRAAGVAPRRSSAVVTSLAVGDHPPAAAVTTRAAVGADSPGATVDGTPFPPAFTLPDVPTLAEQFDAAIYGVLNAASNFLSWLPAGPVTEFLQGALLMVRRTFFDQLPTVNPVQRTGQLTGAITGTIGAIDPEGDPITYRVVEQPQDGLVTIDANGTYTYTPDPDFTGSDAFIIEATDRTSAPTLLDAASTVAASATGTQAVVGVKQGTAAQLSFKFIFNNTEKGQWTETAKLYLEWAADLLAEEIIPAKNVTLTLTANALYDTKDDANLAAADFIPSNSTDPGFFPSLSQSRILTGAPPKINRGEIVFDGDIDVNFAEDWAFGGRVQPGQYDYVSVVMHELLHTLGFTARLKDKGGNTGTNWVTFAKFVTDDQGLPAIQPDFKWDDDFDPNLTGGDGGLYFTGPNTEAVFGAPVPLWTKSPFVSISHLNDNYFNDRDHPTDPRYIQMMVSKDSPGKDAPRELSKLELAIMEDIGYTIAAPIAATPVLAAASAV